jgi:hypothetical protein
MPIKKALFAGSFLLLLFAGFYYLNSRIDRQCVGNAPEKKDSATVAEKAARVAIATDPIKEIAPDEGISIDQIISQGKPVICKSDPADEVQGITLISDGSRLKIQVIDKTSGNKVYNILTNNGFDYSWPLADNPAEGFKVNVEKIQEQAKKDGRDIPKFGKDMKMNVECLPWVVDDGLLELPAGINFEDRTAEIEKNAPAN